MICLTPIIVAWIGLMNSRSQKKTKEILEAQKRVEEAKAEIDRRDKAELNKKFDMITNSITDLKAQFSRMDKTVSDLSSIGTKISGLIELSSANLELCQSLSMIVSSIGDALDSTDGIDSGDLKEQLHEHRKKEQALTQKITKIIY